jgi:hypothetical protein
MRPTQAEAEVASGGTGRNMRRESEKVAAELNRLYRDMTNYRYQLAGLYTVQMIADSSHTCSYFTEATKRIQ